MNRGFKFRIYPTKEQKILINKTFGCCRWIYNHLLHDKQEAYHNGIKFNKTLAEYKKDNPWLKDVDPLAINSAANHLNIAYKNFFKKLANFPKFKSKKDSKQSYTTNNLPAKQNIKLENNLLKLPKLGFIKIKLHRQLPKNSIIKSVTVLRNAAGKYYVSILVEYDYVAPKKKLDKENSVGLDYKSDGLYVDNQGNKPNYPKFYRQTESKLAKEQRKLSKMVKGSSNYEKQRIKVAKINEKIANQRKDFLHKLSYELANKYDYIFVEDINLQDISQFGNVGKSTHDNGFGMFRTMLSYKMLERGKVFYKIDKWFPSSKTCSSCGCYHKDIVKDLSIREWECPDCGSKHDRDVNAAKNIRQFGINNVYKAI